MAGALCDVLDAAVFAAWHHRDQRRKGANPKDVPYIQHPLEVACLLAHADASTDVVRAGLLHDTVEDTDVTPDMLREHFGDTVARLVQEVTDDKSLPPAERKKLQIEHAAHASTGARIIKLADKLNNLQSLVQNPPAAWPRERIQGYFLWSREVIARARGVSPQLEEQLDKLYGSEFVRELDLPSAPDAIEADLQAYYASL